MAFWGIEVKPEEPYTHLYDNARGRLRICQATLGTGNSASRSVVQCNVGDNSPVFLCSLIPEKAETCRLELEFEEAEDEVVFSVLGQKSVHLSGYYVGRPGRISDEDELDSYGEDIADTDTSGSYDSFDDEYESDFIDDGDNAIFHSPHRKSGVVIEETTEDEKPSTGNAGRRRLKKKYQMSDSDDHDDSKPQPVVKQNNLSIFESEDEDGFPISMHSRKVRDEKPLETATKASAEERVNDELDKDQKKEVKEQKVESSGIETDDTENDSKPKKKKKKKKKKKGKKSETDAVGPVKQTDAHVKEKANEPGKLPTGNAQERSVKSRKKNRKRKRRDGNSEETEKNANAMELQNSNVVEQLSNVSPGVESDKTTDDDRKDEKGIEADKTTDDDRKDAKGKKKKKRKKNKNIVKD